MDTRGISISQLLKHGWSRTKNNLGVVIGIQIFSFFILVLPGVVFQPGFIASTLQGLISVFISLGFVTISLRLLSEEKIHFSDFFSRSNRYLHFFLATVATTISIVFGYILLIIPGIYLTIRLCMVPFLIVDQDISVMEAFSKSWQMTKGSLWDLFLWIFIAIPILTILGLLALLVGLLIALPVIYFGYAKVYQELKEKPHEVRLKE